MPRKKKTETNDATPTPDIEAEACSEMNEGIPTKPLPKEGLPAFKAMTPEEEPPAAAPKKGEKKKPDGMQKALDILDEYYDETPKRDIRFHHDEE